MSDDPVAHLLRLTPDEYDWLTSSVHYVVREQLEQAARIAARGNAERAAIYRQRAEAGERVYRQLRMTVFPRTPTWRSRSHARGDSAVNDPFLVGDGCRLTITTEDGAQGRLTLFDASLPQVALMALMGGDELMRFAWQPQVPSDDQEQLPVPPIRPRAARILVQDITAEAWAAADGFWGLDAGEPREG